MTDRTLVDGNFIKQDESTPGQVKLIVTPGDSIGSPGQVLTNVAGALSMAGLPPQTSNATINFQRFNSSGTWTKPAGLNASSLVLIRAWGGGGSGGNNGNAAGGGGGGPMSRWILLSQLGATETVTVAAGGAGVANGNGAAGGNSTFGAHLTAFGGGAGDGAGTILSGGGGGGPLGAGGTGVDAAGLPGVPLIVSDPTGPRYLGQGAASGLAAPPAIDHGGGGGWQGTAGGNSVRGGGGGGGNTGSVAGAGGTSIEGGNGGAAGINGAIGTGGVQPGGGGGSSENGASSGAGGAGRVDVIVFGFPA